MKNLRETRIQAPRDWQLIERLQHAQCGKRYAVAVWKSTAKRRQCVQSSVQLTRPLNRRVDPEASNIADRNSSLSKPPKSPFSAVSVGIAVETLDFDNFA